MESQTGYLERDGARIYYEVAGSGSALLLNHAGICTHAMWDDVWPALAARHRVIRWDGRGFGRTTTEDVPFSNRQDMCNLLDHLGVERAAVLGCSRGGLIAVDFALEHPERVAALVAVCAGVSGFAPDLAQIDAGELALFEECEAAEEREEWQRVAELDVRLWVDGPRSPAGRAPAALRERVYAMSLSNYTGVPSFGRPQRMEPPAAGRLAQIGAPTLVIAGELDSGDMLQAADLLASSIPGARRVTFAGAAHLPSMEQPEAFSRAVLEFLAGQGL